MTILIVSFSSTVHGKGNIRFIVLHSISKATSTNCKFKMVMSKIGGKRPRFFAPGLASRMADFCDFVNSEQM